MKKKLLIIAFAAVSVLLISCQKENVGKITPSDPVAEDEANVLTSFTTPAGPEADTKMQYGYVDNTSSWKVTKTWEPGKDTLIGFEKVAGTDPVQYKYFTFACEASTEKGMVKWTRVSDMSDAKYPRGDSSATLYMAYAPRMQAKAFSDNKGEIYISDSLINQRDGWQRTITCGTGSYYAASKKLDVKFSNKMAMLAIIKPTLSGVTSAKTIYDVSLDNVYTAGTLKEVSGKLEFVKDENSKGLIYQKLASGLTTDETGLLKDTIYVPIIPGTNLNQLKVRISTEDEDYEYSVGKDKTIDTVLYRILTKPFTAKKVAKYSTDGGSSWTECSTIMAAMNAVSQSETAATVQLLEDCTIKSAMDSITNTAGVTLDLNGYTLRSTAANIEYKDGDNNGKIDDRRVYVAGGKLTIKDSGTNGKLTDNLSNTHLVIVTGGTLTVKSGTLNSTASAAVYVPKNQTTSTPIIINLQGGTIIGESESTGAVGIEDGTCVYLTVSGSAAISSTTSRGIYTGNKAIVEVTSGSVESKSVCINHNGTINPTGDNPYGLHISGGEFITTGQYYPIYFNTSTCSACIEGSAYLSSGDNYSIYCSKNSSSSVTIKKTNDVEGPYFHRTGDGNIIAKATASQSSYSVSGGYFSTDEGLSGRIADGYGIITLDTPVSHPTHTDKKFSYKVDIPTASIFQISDGTTTKKYTTQGAAMDALFGETPDKDFTGNQITVELLTNYSLSEILSFNAPKNSGKTYTFDLGGKTLTTGNSSAYLKAESNTKLTIINGNISGDDYYCFYPTDTTEVTISSDVTIINSGTSRGAIYHVGKNSKLTLDGCIVKVSNENSTQSAVYVNNVGANLTVKKLTKLINDGKGRTLNATVGTISIEDGVKSRPYIPSINLSLTQYQDKFATGEEFSTVASNYTGTTDEAFFECIPMTITAAVEKANAASAPSTIKLLMDKTLSETIIFANTKPVTLDLNGKTLNAPVYDSETAPSAIVLGSEQVTAPEMTIKSSQENGTIAANKATNAAAVIVKAGTLSFESGKLLHDHTGNTRKVLVISGNHGNATVNMSGGTITGGIPVRLGSGSSSKKTYFNMTGGEVNGTTTSIDAKYATIWADDTYGYVTIIDGIVKSNKAAALYMSQSYCTFTIGDTSHSPRFYKTSSTGNMFSAYSTSSAGRYTINQCYVNYTTMHADIANAVNISTTTTKIDDVDYYTVTAKAQ